MDLTIRLRDLADDWNDLGQPVNLRRSTVYELCEIVDDTEALLKIIRHLELKGVVLSIEQRNIVRRTRNELDGLNSRNIL